MEFALEQNLCPKNQSIRTRTEAWTTPMFHFTNKTERLHRDSNGYKLVSLQV